MDGGATLATPTKNHASWLKRVRARIDDAEVKKPKIEKVVIAPYEVVLTDKQKRSSALRVQAGLAYGYWLSPFCRKLPDAVRRNKLIEFLDNHMLPYAREDAEFASRVSFLAFSFDLSSSTAFLGKMSCSPEKLFDFILK
jgi:hypothetical protein